MDVDAGQHVVVGNDVRENSHRIRIHCINIEYNISILDTLQDQFFVLLRLSAILPVSFEHELLHHCRYALLVEWVGILLYWFGHFDSV